MSSGRVFRTLQCLGLGVSYKGFSAFSLGDLRVFSDSIQGVVISFRDPESTYA